MFCAKIPRLLLCAVALATSVAGANALTLPAFDPARILQPFVDRHELAGAVMLVETKDKVLSLETVGYADVAAKKPMRTDTLFWIASMSKPITATALMMLVDEGKVRLDDPVERYLPQFQPRIMIVTDGAHVQLRRPQHVMTVRSLLSHTSGMQSHSALEVPTFDVYPLAVRVQSYALQPMILEPGTDHVYSNAGINTAARIVEVVSGMPFEDFLQQRLLSPLGMKDTTFWPTEAQVQRLAKSYEPDAAGTGLQETTITLLHYPLTDRKVRYAMPAGGLFSTASDIGRFCQMILNGGTLNGKRYVSAASIRQMGSNQLDPAMQGAVEMKRFGSEEPWDFDGYGLGWRIRASGVLGHSGAYSTFMRIDPTTGLATVWMVQHVGFPGEGAKSHDAFEAAAAAACSKRH